MKKRIQQIIKGLLIAVAVLIAIQSILVLVTARQVKKAYAAIEAAGLPTTPEDVIPAPVPENENAAPLYLEAIAAIHEATDGLASEDNPLRAKLAELSKEDLADLQAFLQQPKLVAALELVNEAVQKPRTRFDNDYLAGPSMTIPHIQGIQNIQKLLTLHVLGHAHEGKSEKAYATLTTAFECCEAVQDEPTLISQLVRIAQINRTIETLNQLLVLAPPSTEQKQKLQAQLEAILDNTNYQMAIDGERLLFGEWFFGLPHRKGGISESLEKDIGGQAAMIKLYSSFLGKPIFQADHAAYLRVITGDQRMEDVPKYCIFTRMLAPALSSVEGKFEQLKVRIKKVQADLK